MSTIIRLVGTVVVLALAAFLWSSGDLIAAPEAVITWSTESEVDTAGFHVYRADQELGPYERVTDQMIPAGSDPFSGNEYEFRDPNLAPGRTYYYQLEELETTGRFTRLDETVSYRSNPEPNWPVALALLGALLLIWLLDARTRQRPAAHLEHEI